MGLRGPLVPQDVDLPHPHQPREDPRRSRRADGAVAGFGADDIGAPDTAVSPDRFWPADHPTEPGHWASPPQDLGTSPEHRLLGREAGEQLQKAIDALPANQRLVLTLRDVEGCSTEELCNALGIQETNGRVLLHRARAKVRAALEPYLEGG